MADESTTTNADDNSTVTTSTNEDVTFDSIADVDVAELNDDQKAFILDNSGELSDEQRETYKDILEDGGDDGDEEDLDPQKVEIQIREPQKEGVGGGEEDDEGEEIDPEDKKNIGKVVDEKLTDFRKSQSDVQVIKDKQEVNDYVNDNPEFKKYRGVMLKYMSHPAYRNIPASNIAKIVAGNDLQKLGAQKERQAAAKVKKTHDSGNTTRKPSGGETDWGSASKEAFEKKKNEVMGIRA